ncbi:hypothetical protein [Candidatus Arsenophonus triatominarum]|uniref:hypothetical protein n=1 Tax=Candidatus Arsenophonus triatominarum TaxID=57911 RepID=UPI0007C47F43|nr:hypothetical protein [Candidatus Arsenophonus triatominarum]
MTIFDFNLADVLNSVSGGSPLSIIDSVLHPAYVIRKHGSAEVALNFSGMSVFQPTGKASIINAPIEKGRYQSINKIYQPTRITCQVVISGLSGFSSVIPNLFDLTLISQNETLQTIGTMLKTTDLYDIETPKGNYASFDLTDYSYRVSAQAGVTLLTVALIFQEVIQQMEVVLNTPQSANKPTGDLVARSPYGTCPIDVNGSEKMSTLDELSKTWDALKNSIGPQRASATAGVNGSFRSAMDTVHQSASRISGSVSQKSGALWKKIKGAVL